MNKPIINQLNNCIEIGNSIAKALDELSKNGHLYPRGSCPQGCKGRDSFVAEMKVLSTMLQNIKEHYSRQIDKWLNGISVPNSNCVNQYNFNVLMSLLQMLVDENSKPKTAKKLFISHSSKDKEIVATFMDKILQLGIGLSHDDIFCTSIEETAIRNGEDIRKHIQDNIRNADYSFLLISKNYKESEICINEMGAVWAYDNSVRIFLLPDVDFDSIGWLYDTKKAEKINDTIALDALQKELIQFYSLSDKGISWSRQRETFLEYIRNAAILQSI